MREKNINEKEYIDNSALVICLRCLHCHTRLGRVSGRRSCRTQRSFPTSRTLHALMVLSEIPWHTGKS